MAITMKLSSLLMFLFWSKKSYKLGCFHVHYIRWVMGKHIHLHGLKALKAVMMGAQYLLVTCIEITCINNQEWLFICVYGVEN
jgi:hypothetical protein